MRKLVLLLLLCAWPGPAGAERMVDLLHGFAVDLPEGWRVSLSPGGLLFTDLESVKRLSGLEAQGYQVRLKDPWRAREVGWALAGSRFFPQPWQDTGGASEVDQQVVAVVSSGGAVVDEQIGARDPCLGGHHQGGPVGPEGLVALQ